MAYGIHFGTVPFSQISAYQSHQLARLTPGRVCVQSHILPGYIDHLPLRQLLFEAFDGGETLRPDLWHPWRDPQFHRTGSVAALACAMTPAFREMIAGMDEKTASWHEIEPGALIPLFNEAAAEGLCIVSVLDLPCDRERAEKIVLPFPCDQSDIAEFCNPWSEKT